MVLVLASVNSCDHFTAVSNGALLDGRYHKHSHMDFPTFQIDFHAFAKNWFWLMGAPYFSRKNVIEIHAI